MDFIFDIPVRVAQEIVGFRYDGASSAVFEVLRVTSGNKSKMEALVASVGDKSSISLKISAGILNVICSVSTTVTIGALMRPFFRASLSLFFLLRVRFLLAFLLIILLPFVYPWRGRTNAEYQAASNVYFNGLWARIDDLILWKHALVGGVAFLTIMAVFAIAVYYLSVWMQSFEQKGRSGQ